MSFGIACPLDARVDRLHCVMSWNKQLLDDQIHPLGCQGAPEGEYGRSRFYLIGLALYVRVCDYFSCFDQIPIP